MAEAIESAGGSVWYLPPYSPDLNPIERMWSKVKRLLNHATARAQRSLQTAIGESLRAVKTTELRHYYAAAGYATIE